MRRAAKVDAVQREVVAHLRAIGADVRHLHAVGQGCPDLLVGYRRATYLLEVKSPGGSLTPAQVAWHRDWKGLPVAVVHSVEEALDAIGARENAVWAGGEP